MTHENDCSHMGLPESLVFTFSLTSLVHFIFLIQTSRSLTPCKRTHISKKEKVKVCHEGASAALVLGDP